MSPRSKPGLGSTLLLVSLTYAAVFLSLLSSYNETHHDRPIPRFFLSLSPWWISYLSARWYIRLAEQSSPLYHPFGCLAQCCVWVFHWILSTYHAFFVTKFTIWTYLVTIYCAAVVVFQEGLFHSLITAGCKNTEYLGFYETARKSYGKGLTILVNLWYLVDVGSPTLRENGTQRPTLSRSATM